MTDSVSMRTQDGRTNKKISAESPLILASASARRKDLLARFGIPTRVLPVAIDEAPKPGEKGSACAQRLATAKFQTALSIHPLEPSAYVLAADTVVSLNEGICDKPRSDDDARQILKALSGQVHEVITATCVGDALDPRAGTLLMTTTTVEFFELSVSTIDAYIRTGEGRDKAGAYAIQGRGAYLVKRIQGSYENVVGLPVVDVIRHLVSVGVLDEPFC